MDPYLQITGIMCIIMVVMFLIGTCRDALLTARIKFLLDKCAELEARILHQEVRR